MSRITYLVGDATEPQGTGAKIIAHCVSDNGHSYGKGFALQLAKKWPNPMWHYRENHAAGLVVPGECIMAVTTDPKIQVASLVGQHGLGPHSLRHDWLRAALGALVTEAIRDAASIHMPRIGCGLAGGKWTEVEPLIEGVFNLPLASFVPLFVYDLPP